MIGNSRLHWAWFKGSQLQRHWDMSHLSDQGFDQFNQIYQIDEQTIDRLLAAQVQSDQVQSAQFQMEPSRERDHLNLEARPLDLPSAPPLIVAAVVPDRLRLWQTYRNTQTLTLDDIPLLGKYPTLGIDRALAAWGAAQTVGLPVLVIDAGTALTYTGLDAAGRLVGGAILPGLGLQLRSLNQHTAALPAVDSQALILPERWSLNTADAIRSGVFYTLLAGLKEAIDTWRAQFPTAAIVLTGGDGAQLLEGLRQRYADWASPILFDPHLIFWGMRQLVTQ